MNYLKAYFSIIRNRKNNPLNPEKVYLESHHIIPRSLGGSNKKSNLVNLTAREHFICHLLLVKIFEKRKVYNFNFDNEKQALKKMSYGIYSMKMNGTGERYLNSYLYSKFKNKYSVNLKKYNKEDVQAMLNDYLTFNGTSEQRFKQLKSKYNLPHKTADTFLNLCSLYNIYVDVKSELYRKNHKRQQRIKLGLDRFDDGLIREMFQYYIDNKCYCDKKEFNNMMKKFDCKFSRRWLTDKFYSLGLSIHNIKPDYDTIFKNNFIENKNSQYNSIVKDMYIFYIDNNCSKDENSYLELKKKFNFNYSKSSLRKLFTRFGLSVFKFS